MIYSQKRGLDSTVYNNIGVYFYVCPFLVVSECYICIITLPFNGIIMCPVFSTQFDVPQECLLGNKM